MIMISVFCVILSGVRAEGEAPCARPDEDTNCVVDPLGEQQTSGGVCLVQLRGFLERADLRADSPVRTADNGTAESRASVRADAGSIR